MAQRKSAKRKKTTTLKPPEPSDEQRASGIYDDIPKDTGELPEGERVIKKSPLQLRADQEEQILARELAKGELTDAEKLESPLWRRVRSAGRVRYELI